MDTGKNEVAAKIFPVYADVVGKLPSAPLDHTAYMLAKASFSKPFTLFFSVFHLRKFHGPVNNNKD